MIASLLGAILFLSACSTAPKPGDENLRYISGKALIYDKLKQKQDWVNFTATIGHPEKLRIDAYLGILGIPLGTLVINEEDAVFLNLVEKKAYKTKRGSAVLEKLLKTPIAAGDVIALFAEKFPLRGGWQCSGAEMKQKCAQGELTVDWSRTPADDKSLVIESPKSKINFAYTQKSSGATVFDLKIPSHYETINL